MRSIRRLDGHRSSPLLLKSLRFWSEGEIDAYHFPQESSFTWDILESGDGEDSTISRESTPVLTSNSELENEADRWKPQQWTDLSESESVEICTSHQLSALNVDDEASSPEPREPFTVYKCDEEVDE